MREVVRDAELTDEQRLVLFVADPHQVGDDVVVCQIRFAESGGRSVAVVGRRPDGVLVIGVDADDVDRRVVADGHLFELCGGIDGEPVFVSQMPRLGTCHRMTGRRRTAWVQRSDRLLEFRNRVADAVAGHRRSRGGGRQVLLQVELVAELPHQDRFVVAITVDDVRGVLAGERPGLAIHVGPRRPRLAEDRRDLVGVPEQRRHQTDTGAPRRVDEAVHAVEVFGRVAAVQIPIVGEESAGVKPRQRNAASTEFRHARLERRVVAVAEVTQESVVVVDPDGSKGDAVADQFAVGDGQPVGGGGRCEDDGRDKAGRFAEVHEVGRKRVGQTGVATITEDENGSIGTRLAIPSAPRELSSKPQPGVYRL